MYYTQQIYQSMSKKQEEKRELTKSLRVSEDTHEKMIKAQIKLEGIHQERFTFDEVIELLCNHLHLNTETFIKST